MKRFVPAILALALMVPGAAQAAGDAATPGQRSWSWDGLFGTYDRAQLQKGLEIHMMQCMNCHSLKYVHFRDLVQLGYSEDEIKALASQYDVAGEPDEWGDPTVRPAELFDPFPSPYRNEKEARALNNGAVPPDLSLMAKARKDGSNYLASLLSDDEYNEGNPDDGGLYPNHYFAGGKIAMAPPLWPDMLGDGATLDEEAEAIAAFLTWAAEPKLEERKGMGMKVLLFLLILTGLFYVSKRKIWANVHH
ncbi:MAG: cytochrome c1 [Rhodospirillales bacterium]|nr:cytochrome c1 [Rhodospirillales bacterium]